MIISAYAGVIAERRFSGRAADWVGARSDLDTAADLILHCVGGNPDLVTHYERWLWQSAEVLVDRSWRHIEAVAAALVVSTTLDEVASVPRAASGASAGACASRAYSFFDRPDSISSDATTTSVFQCRLRHCQVPPTEAGVPE